MRRQIDGLSALVAGVMQHNPLSDGLFVFINKQCDKLKILMWERNGFVVWYKRSEQEKFQWPVRRNIYVRSRRAGEWVMAFVSQFLTGKLRLKVNEATRGGCANS